MAAAAVDMEFGVDAGFVQGGLGLLSLNPQRQPPEETTLFSLANLFYEPVWLFYQGRQELTSFAQLKGLRVAIGPQGSGSRKVALELFSAAGPDVIADLRDLGYQVFLDLKFHDIIVTIGDDRQSADVHLTATADADDIIRNPAIPADLASQGLNITHEIVIADIMKSGLRRSCH